MRIIQVEMTIQALVREQSCPKMLDIPDDAAGPAGPVCRT
jgi:hypothetical protein